MRTERMDIRVYRNADYREGWQLGDEAGAPLDLTGCSMQMKIRAVAGQGSVIGSASVTMDDASLGIFTVRIPGSLFTYIPGATEIVRLAYDLVLTYPDGVKAVPVAGQIILTPGVTY